MSEFADQWAACNPAFAEALDNLIHHQWCLAYERFREAVFGRLGAREAHHHDNLPEVLRAHGWLGLGQDRGLKLCAALALDYRFAGIMGGCYSETFRDLYGEEDKALRARAAAETILARCDEIEGPESRTRSLHTESG